MTNVKVVIDWLKTGAPGLEHVFGDGIPEFPFGLGLGLPGCAEVMLAYQIIVALASPQWPAPGKTVPGAPSDSRLRYQQQFNFGRGDTLKSVVRCVRAHGRERRVMALVKIRGSAHSGDLREPAARASDTQIGAALTGQEVLLDGEPTAR